MLSPGLDGAPPILQFGTGRFLQAHVDLLVSEAAATPESRIFVSFIKDLSSA